MDKEFIKMLAEKYNVSVILRYDPETQRHSIAVMNEFGDETVIFMEPEDKYEHYTIQIDDAARQLWEQE